MKLSHENLNKIIEKCTKKEIDVMIYFIHRQNDEGKVKGINYKEVMEFANIAKSTFFSILKSLENKEIISISNENEHSYWSLKIINNSFLGKEDYKKGYVKFHYNVFYSKKFINLTKGEKVCILNLLKVNRYNKREVKITLKRICEWTGKSLRSVKKFVISLENVFKIIKINSQYVIFDCLNSLNPPGSSEKEVKNLHLLNYILNKTKCKKDQLNNNLKEKKDVTKLMIQFESYGQEKILNSIKNCIDTFGMLIPSFINTRIRA